MKIKRGKINFNYNFLVDPKLVIINVKIGSGSKLNGRVAGAALFGWSRSQFFGLAPAPPPTHRTVNILFLETLSMTVSPG